jgi:hypothetical protein
MQTVKTTTILWAQIPREIWHYFYNAFHKYGNTSNMNDILIDYENLLRTYGVIKPDEWHQKWWGEVYNALVQDKEVRIFWSCSYNMSLTNTAFFIGDEDTSTEAAKSWAEINCDDILVIVRIRKDEFTVETYTLPRKTNTVVAETKDGKFWLWPVQERQFKEEPQC